jgi:thymidylate kinase
MSDSRKSFLTTLFLSLERSGIRYCVLRNYNAIYEDDSSDVDMIVEPADVARTRECLVEAAAQTHYKLVHRARYVNYSDVLWHDEGGFLRVDIETEVRWRIFTALSANAVINLRRRHREFYVPHPRHESVILFVAAIWRRHISERYRQQLGHLFSQIKKPAELERTFHAAFGSVGVELARYQASGMGTELPDSVWSRARRSMWRNSLRSAPNRRAMLRYLAMDITRLEERLRFPAGISLLCVSTGEPGVLLQELLRRMEFLYPAQKSARLAFQVPAGNPGVARLTLRLQFERVRTLFKGGVFLRYYSLQDRADVRRVVAFHAWTIYPSRVFICEETQAGETCLAHSKSGFMQTSAPGESTDLAAGRLVQFVCGVMERGVRPSGARPPAQGVSVVLLGLDGSGKTTIARQLCSAAGDQPFCNGVRYFHWIPVPFRRHQIPLADSGLTPRKEVMKASFSRSLASNARLLKNLLVAKLGFRLRVKRLKKRGCLVLMDRYFYNYLLDPVSVKYYGSARLLEWARNHFPAPDLAVVLGAQASILLKRKPELSEPEIRRQSALLESMPLRAGRILRLDATRNPAEIATEIMKAVNEIQMTNRPFGTGQLK